MPRKARELKPIQVARIVEPGRHPIGGVAGLYLQVLPTGGRSWILRVVVGSKRRDIGLGGYPDVSLAQAREAAQEKRKLVADGIDPVHARAAAKSALKATQANSWTFERAATTYIKKMEPGWKNAKHAQQWRNTLDTFAFPKIGDLLLDDIGNDQVLDVLEPIWTTKTATATRLRGRIEQVLDWATGRGYRTGANPARWKGGLKGQLVDPKKGGRKAEHHAALAIDATPAFVRRLREQEGMSARALEFAILTATRSGEVRGATRDEFDLKARLWVIPASRMKAGREHRVPLSDAALAVLRKAPTFAGSDLMFASPRGGALSDMSMTAVLRRLEVNAVPHGFRSTFRDWAAERTQHANIVAEQALAHTIGDKVEAAYRRGDLLDRRRSLMEDWAAFVGSTEKPRAGRLPAKRRERMGSAPAHA